MTNEDKIAGLEGKVLCDADGTPVKFTEVDIVERLIVTENKKKPMLQLQGIARGTLLNPQNPQQGHEPLKEPVAVSVEHDLLDKDPQILLKQLTQSLDLEGADALVDDGGDWVNRFDPADPKSLVKPLREKGSYVKLAKKNNWEKAVKHGDSPFYFNIHNVPKRTAASTSILSRISEQLKKKNAAKLGGGVLGGDGASETDSSWS